MQPTSRLKVNPPLGEMPALEIHPIGALRIDASYQRTLERGPSQTLIRRIAQFWDWNLCQPLVCSKREGREGLYVVDGQHRLAAARLRPDIPRLPCVVTAYGSAAAEAASFVQLNQQRRPLGALDLFKAGLAAEDGETKQIMALLRQAGLDVAPHTNPTAWKPGQIANVGGLQRCFRRHGRAITLQSLNVLSEGFAGQVLRYAGTIFGAIHMLIAFERAEERKLQVESMDLAIVVETLQTRPQAEWMRLFRKRRGEEGGGQDENAFRVLQDEFLEVLGESLGLNE